MRVGSGVCGVLIVAMLLGGGCSYTHEPAAAFDEDVAASTSVIASGLDWPARLTEGLPSGETRTTFAPAPDDHDAGDRGDRKDISLTWVQELTPIGQGLVVSDRTELRGENGEVYRASGSDWNAPGFVGTFGFYTFRADRPFPRLRRWPNDGERRGPIDRHGLRRRSVLSDEFEVMTPSASAWPPKGIALVKHGLGGTEYTRPIERELLRRGWVVISSEGLSWGFERVERALEEDSSVRAGTSQSAGTRSAAAPKPKAMTVDEAATTFAQGSQLFADIAYAWEAALAYTEGKCEVVAGKPVVYVGFSFGGIVGPTVVARLGDRVKASVLAGAGANLMGIASESDIDGLDLMLAGPDGKRIVPGTPRYDEVSELYLQKAAWDSYNTAPLLKGRPVLLVQGRSDTTVPSYYGELLWERLGRPERWSAWYGHPLLIYFIGDHRSEIVDWLERHVEAGVVEAGEVHRDG